MTPPTIDAVITWVDGSDPAHKTKLQNYLKSIGIPPPPAAAPTRFHNAGEIDYCVASIFKFAPWIRHIHIATDAQIPPLVTTLKDSPFAERIKIVDHKTIFAGFEQYLPTFNSTSILSVLWRIPRLSEKFIFFNDDFMLVQPVSPDDFFRNDQVVLRGTWDRFTSDKWQKKITHFIKTFGQNSASNKKPKSFSYTAAQEFSARLLGFTEKFFKINHNPHPMRLSAQRRYFEANPEQLERNIRFRLRDPEQFIIDSLAPHLDIKENVAIFENRLKTMNLKPGDQALFRLRKKLEKVDNDKNYAFVCVQSLESGSQTAQKTVINWLAKKIGHLSDLANMQHSNK